MMANEETQWRKVRFALWLTIAATILFVLLTKIFFPVPVVESVDLLNSINHSEKILKEQRDYAERVKKIRQDIDTLDFAIYQVQRMDEIKEDISLLQNVYRRNNMSSKYFFGVQASKTLKLYFDTKEELSSIIRNNEIIEKNLDECKANI